MKYFQQRKMKGGWFIGDFEPTAFKTSAVEVCLKIHPKGERWDSHYHKIATEINLLVRGRMTINSKEFHSGDIFLIEPEEVATPEFLEDCEIIVVKVPSVQGDKYIV